MIRISILGYILIPVGLFLFLKKKDALLFAAIITCGLTGSSVLSLGDTALQPSYYFALLWMVRRFISHTKNRIVLKIDAVSKLLLIFGILCTVSLIMPTIMSGKVTVLNVDDKIVPLSFSSSNITQLIYIIFCIVFFFELRNWLKTNAYGDKIVKKIFKSSIIIVLIITIYQIIAYRIDLPFDILFKTGAHMDQTSAIFWDKRISGPCLEASMFAYYLVACLPILSENLNKTTDYLLLITVIVLGIMSLSSTFFVGLVLWLAYSLIKFLSKKKISCKKTLYLFTIISIGVIITFSNTRALELINDTINAFVLKLSLNSQSGIERNQSFRLLIDVFYQSPLLGVGFGSSRGKDLFSTWLANIGILGCISFLVFICRGLKNKHGSWVNATILVWICILTSVPEPYNLFIWIIMAVSMLPQHTINNREINNEKN